MTGRLKITLKFQKVVMLLLILYTALFIFVASECMHNSSISSSNSSRNSTAKDNPNLSKTFYREPFWEPPIALPLTKAVEAPDRPFFVKVYNLDTNDFCGGTVLKYPPPSLIVITAAHCIGE